MPKQTKPKTHWMDPDQRPTILTRQQTARIHFASRLHSRHKMNLTSDEIATTVRGIQLGRAQKLTAYDHGRNLYVVALRGKLVAVAYDFLIKALVTILPDGDPRIEKIAKNPGRSLTKWLQETKHAAKEAAAS